MQFVDRWVTSVVDADHILVADTGSTDGTATELLRHHVSVANIVIKPFRFDDARNAALALMPSDLDVVIALDMDEIMTTGWRENLEQCWTADCTRLRYQYIWSWTVGGEPDLQYYGDKITGRHTHRWRHPVHEVMIPTIPEVQQFCHKVLIEHHADSKKPRGQYLNLLRLAVSEDPFDDRNAHYLGREFYFNRMYDDSISELQRHLALPQAQWNVERAASMRYIAKCYEAKGDIQSAGNWFIRATLEAATRESLIDAARFQLAHQNFYAVIAYCEQALQLAACDSYMNERYARAEGPYDLAAVAYFHIGDRMKAIEYAKIAIERNPHDLRLKTNLAMMGA